MFIWGLNYGYNPNATKTKLVVPENMVEHTKTVIGNYTHMKEVQVVTGCRRFGGHIGSTSLRNEYVQSKILEWEYDLDQLTMVAKYYPQAPFTGFTKCVMNRMIFLMRTIPDIDKLFKPIETL